MKKALLRKSIMFIVGYCLYIAIEVTFRGYSFILMGICGGVLFILIDSLNNQISWDIDILLQGISGAALITLTELLVGEALKAFNLPPMWDYSNIPLNYDGVICLPFSLLWIIVSLTAIVLADAINYYVFKIQPVPYYKLFGRVVFTFKS